MQIIGLDGPLYWQPSDQWQQVCVQPFSSQNITHKREELDNLKNLKFASKWSMRQKPNIKELDENSSIRKFLELLKFKESLSLKKGANHLLINVVILICVDSKHFQVILIFI